LTHGEFHEVLPDVTKSPDDVTRILCVQGKVYYDLAAYRDEVKRDDVAIIRLEQLYPFPAKALEARIVEVFEESVRCSGFRKNLATWAHGDF
jgi:2-oxoglutarate dehydrogenase E1 component